MVKRENGYPEEQYALIIMDTFKGQENDRLRKLCAESHCEVAIVPHNLTNKFQPLDISVNRGVDPTKVKITSKFQAITCILDC